MSNIKKLACALGAVVLTSGCVHTGSLEGSSAAAASMAPAPAAEAEAPKLRALPSYGAMGGYRYRRFASSAASG